MNDACRRTPWYHPGLVAKAVKISSSICGNSFQTVDASLVTRGRLGHTRPELNSHCWALNFAKLACTRATMHSVFFRKHFPVFEVLRAVQSAGIAVSFLRCPAAISLKRTRDRRSSIQQLTHTHYIHPNFSTVSTFYILLHTD